MTSWLQVDFQLVFLDVLIHDTHDKKEIKNV